jgi:HSP20 family molecular chaperone IbpA
MAFMYYYPPPQPYAETRIHETFPEHHWPLDQPAHKVAHNLKEWFGPIEAGIPTRALHADVRETEQRFYVDIELPGAQKKDVTIKWVNDASLLITANIGRPTLEEPKETQDEVEAGAQNGGQVGSSGGVEIGDHHGAVHLLSHGRQLGHYARSFYFAVDIDHDTIDTHLRDGLLRIRVDKKPHAQKAAREVEVKHDDTVSA